MEDEEVVVLEEQQVVVLDGGLKERMVWSVCVLFGHLLHHQTSTWPYSSHFINVDRNSVPVILRLGTL